jgi:PAS domain S-box-containing protein
VVVLTDINERKALQAAKAADLPMLRLRRERTDQGIWFIDEQQRTVDANPAMRRLLALPLEQLRGRPIRDFVDEDGAALLRETLERRRRGQSEANEISHRAADGTRRHCVNNATPIAGPRGPLTGSVGLWTDITPLNAVLGFAQLLDLINDVRDLARIEAGALRQQSQPVELCGLVREYEGLVAGLMAQRDVRLALQCPG